MEVACPVKERRVRVIDFESHKNRQGIRGKHTKKSSSLADSLKELPQQTIYDLDVGGLDGQYGENNWRIVCWHKHKQLMKLDMPYYTQVVYTPVVSVGLEHDLFAIPYRKPLIDKSVVSCAIMADILYRKFVLDLPFYRQALDYRMLGISLSKQTVIKWVNTLVPEICEEVCEFMTQLHVGYRYTQSDETYIQINKDGYGPAIRASCGPIPAVNCWSVPPLLSSAMKKRVGRTICAVYFGNSLDTSPVTPMFPTRYWKKKVAGTSVRPDA